MLKLAGAVMALVIAFSFGRPALAEDQLTVVSGSQPTGFLEVLGDVAEYAGFYKAEHLVVTTNHAGNPYSAAQLVASGKGDVASITLEAIIQGYEKGLRLTAFFARLAEYEYAIAVLDDSPIKTLADFKGTVLGEYSAGSGAEVSATSMLEGAGLKKSDFSYIPIGSGAQAVQALTSKRVAGAAFPYIELQSYVVNAGQKYRYFWHPILKDIPDAGYVATPATIAAKADILRRFSRANAKAALLVRVNPQLAARMYMQGAGIKITDESLANFTHIFTISEDQLPAYDLANPAIGKLSLAGMGFLANFLYQNGLTAQLVPTAAIATNQFIAFANDFDHKAFIAQAKAMH